MLQALVYDSLASTTAVFSYAIRSRKLSANEQFFVGAQTVVIKFVTNNSDYIRRLFYNYVFYASWNKTTLVWIETELLFLPRVDASHVYVCALALGCFYSHISTRTFRRALTADRVAGQLRGDKAYHFSGYSKTHYKKLVTHVAPHASAVSLLKRAENSAITNQNPGYKKKSRLDSNDCGFICAGVNFVAGYKWHALFYLSCL